MIRILRHICVVLGFAAVFLLMGVCGNIDSKVILVKLDAVLYIGCLLILGLMMICYCALEKIENDQNDYEEITEGFEKAPRSANHKGQRKTFK